MKLPTIQNYGKEQFLKGCKHNKTMRYDLDKNNHIKSFAADFSKKNDGLYRVEQAICLHENFNGITVTKYFCHAEKTYL